MQEVFQLHIAYLSLNTGRSVAKMAELERRTQNYAIPRKFSTWNPPSHTEGAYPQNCMVEQQTNQVSMHSDKFHNPSTCQCWKTSIKTEVCSCSGFPTEATL